MRGCVSECREATLSGVSDHDRPTVLFHLSDIHFGLEDARALAWVERCIAEENPAAILITGDVTMRARTREFVAASEWIGALGPPVTVEVGNHDMPYYLSLIHI